MIRITTTFALLAIAFAVPVAQAEPPDAFERAVIAHRQALDMQAEPPDAFERAVIAHRQALDSQTEPPDAFERAVIAHREALNVPLDPGIAAAIRMHHRSSALPQPTATRISSDRFDWSKFGVIAGAVLALVLCLGGLLTVRARNSQTLKA